MFDSESGTTIQRTQPMAGFLLFCFRQTSFFPAGAPPPDAPPPFSGQATAASANWLPSPRSNQKSRGQSAH